MRLGEEVRNIDEQLRLAQHRDRFNLEQQLAVRTGDILNAMRRYKPDIVHFSGHGSLDGALIFEDAAGKAKPVSAEALGEMFRVQGVRCVVMNACWSDMHADEIAKQVDCVIGMTRSVSDAAAISFAAAFYGSLGDAMSVGEAFDLGKVQIMFDGSTEQQTPRLKGGRASTRHPSRSPERDVGQAGNPVLCYLALNRSRTSNTPPTPRITSAST